MKLLSRFIWLIAGVSALVLIAISILNLKADKEFKRIKLSISEEYNLQIDKVLAPEKSDIPTYCYDVSTSENVGLFLSQPVADAAFVDILLDTMMLNYYKIDAIWFFKGDGTPFHFYSHRGVERSALSLEPNEVTDLMKESYISNFYIENNQKIYRVFSSKMRASELSQGYVFAATEQNNYWISYYQKEINNSEIKITGKDETSGQVPKEIIQIDRDLNGFDGSRIARLNVTLKLPFLKLWSNTTTTDQYMVTAALIVMLLLLILFIYIWVISPLRKISSSLQKSTSVDIQPLLKSHTEMGDVARMIGDYHKKKDELEASESIKRHIIDHAQVGIIIIDRGSKQILTANPYACQLIGGSGDAIIGNPYSTYFPTFDKDWPEQNLLSGSSQNHEGHLVNSLGVSIPILCNINLISMEGKPVYMETFIDLSQIKNLQSQLEEEKLKLDLAMKNSGLHFCEFDFREENLIIPREWEFLKKGTSAKLKENLLQNIYPSDHRIFNDNLEAISSQGRDAFMTEFRVIHPTRGLIWISLSVLITKRDENFNPKQLIGLFEDITERINVQQELIKAKEKAEESDRMKTAYLANMSHKIRTPMNAIVGFANLLTEEDFSQEEKDTYIKIIGRDTEQLLHLIDDIINMARLDAEQLDLSIKPVSVNHLLAELTGYFKANEKTDKISFETRPMLPDGKDILNTDEIKLKLIMNSLLNNAFKFTNSGTIELGYFINPVLKKIILYVKDTGVGIPENSKDKVFDRFYQANSQTEGTGLGLTISKGLIKLLNGQITFESKEGEGTSFFVELPFEQN